MSCVFETGLRLRRLLPLLSGALLALVGGTAQAAVADYQLAKIAFDGDAVPPSETIVTIFSEIAIDDAGRVAFWANVSGEARLFAAEGGAYAVEVAQGDVAPGTGGSTFSDVARPRIATPGVYAWVGSYTGLSGGFLRSGGGDVAMVLPGAALAAGGMLSDVSAIHSAAPGPQVAFGGQVDTGGPLLGAHFAYGPGGLREVYREGQSAPAAVGGVFSGVQPFWEAGVMPDGAVTFGAAVSGGSAADGLFRSSAAGVITPLLLEGDAVTTPGGGTYTFFGRSVAVNAAGDVGYNADVMRTPLPFPYEAVFALEGGVQREIVIRGDKIPGTTPARYFQGLSGSSPPELSDAGLVAFTASIGDAAEILTERAVVVDDAGDLGVLVKEGDAVPGVPGAVFTDFTEARVDATGRIAIYAFTSLGAGVFLATKPPQVPAVPPAGLLFLAVALAGSVAAKRSRSA